PAAAPEHSLLLRKASGQLPHGGGALMKSGDDNHRLIAAWIAQGMPRGDEKAPVVASLEIEPKTRILSKGDSQRLRVIAVYTDGRREDATRHAVFGSNNDDVAGVEKDGRVRVKQQSGEAAISARYQAQVAVFRAFVPSISGQSAKGVSVSFVRRNLIDDHVAKKWADLGIGPSRPTTDAEFVRRVYLDLAGRFPKPEESARFLSSKSSDKRDVLIDELLDGPDYPGLMAMKWGSILQNQRGERNDQAPATHAFAAWLRDAFANDMPFDEFVRAILAAAGTPEQNPPSAWYRNLKGREEMADAFAQVFLGTRIQCARCHHHPNEKWGQEDYAGLTSFFARVQRKPAGRTTDGRAYDAITVARQGVATHPRSGQAVQPHGLDAAPKPVPAGDDPRSRLADWTTAPENPLFARALVNRMWGHLFGRGIVEPVDDFRLTNPPTNPELLDAMVAEFNRGGRRLKPLLKLMASSATYQLSSEPTPANADDRQNYARYYPRRLPAEILSDALDQVTGVATGLSLPAGMRAIDLPDEAGASYLLDVFGRPQRASACECERSSEANLGQSL
ncbi:MAG TPA: DUF1549 and DUF1553 domain-containing protein, partial [Planctomycetia bacterium]|nr:DUF1549 and DUF1553 domain-containing protein [Planctomycetia bacterium]